MPIFDKVRRGERLQIRADQWNAVLDVAERAQRSGNQFGDADQLPPTWGRNVVTIRNDAAVTVPRFGVLQITGVISDPTDRPDLEDEFAAKLALTGGEPTASGLGLVVALEPIKPGSFGRANASGVFACRVDVCTTAHNFAGPLAGSVAALKSAPEGPVQLLWKHGTGTAQWAVAAM